MGFPGFDAGGEQDFPGFEQAQAHAEPIAVMLNLAVWKCFLRNQMPMTGLWKLHDSFDETTEKKWTHKHLLQMKVCRTALP